MERKYISADGKLTSFVIECLRFPMTIAVLLIHSFGPWPVDVVAIHASPLSLEAVYNFLRIGCCNVLVSSAVPAFFMISGWLFFWNVKEWNGQVYFKKMRSRCFSLLIPYLLWNCLFILRVEVFFFGSWLFRDGSASTMLQWLIEKGGG